MKRTLRPHCTSCRVLLTTENTGKSNRRNVMLCRECCAQTAKSETRRLPRFVLAGLLLSFGLSTGCRTVSKAALDEARTAATVGDAIVTKWSTYSDEQKRTAVWKLTRAQFSVVNSVDGTPIPAAYADAAPVKS